MIDMEINKREETKGKMEKRKVKGQIRKFK